MVLVIYCLLTEFSRISQIGTTTCTYEYKCLPTLSRYVVLSCLLLPATGSFRTIISSANAALPAIRQADSAPYVPVQVIHTNSLLYSVLKGLLGWYSGNVK